MTSSIVLVGPMGAGKTSVGRRVARALGRPFADTDKVVVRDHGAIPRLFAEHGEEHFRALERAAVAEALSAGGVVALGGGAVLDPQTRAAIAGHRVVLLTVSDQVVAGRIGGAGRPLLGGDDAGAEGPIGRWTRIYDERRPIYEEVAHVTFDTSSGPLIDVVTRIVEWVRENETPQESA